MQHGNAAKSKNLLNMPRAVRLPAPHLTAGGRLDHPKRPALHQTAQKLPEPIGTPSKHSQVSKTCTNFSPLLTMHEKFQHIASQIYKIHHKELHKFKWAS
jgi:hypothetical protein